ncbi:RICIN domain-containing protein [Streptomyces flavidovirens]|uniref:RICIN domain-containing protein n=1 Tax=Streptomyces flavidovirens TaxID=67298 RepID=UPI00042074E5|nr:RICIN domain-containing protein [Streptomyces flavidovirens]
MSGESDEILGARLRGRAEGATGRPVALLLARHWQAAYDYAAICLASSGSVASMATAAAFHQVFETLGRGQSAEALRPRLLVTVRGTVRAWSADDGISGALPELTKSAGGRGMRAAKSMASTKRELAERSFRTLAGPARCLLWHTQVEGEPIAVPAGLLALDADTATAVLEQAREQLREGCVRAHRELAPTTECRFYNRLLDIPIRRGGALLPDVQQHLLACRYCRDAAEQLALCAGDVGVLLTDAVLGWGARRYLESRPGRGGDKSPSGTSTGRVDRRAEGGRHRLLAGAIPPVHRFAPSRKHSKPLLSGLGLVSATVLSAVLVTSLWSDDGRHPGSAASVGAAGGHLDSPSPRPVLPSAGPPPAESAGLPGVSGQARLRNAATDLCLDVRGAAKPGAGTTMAECSAAKNQQWSYGSDGLLRSLADLELCLDSRADDGATTLRRCVGPSSAANVDDLRYDLTVQGQLLPRWAEGLAVVPTSAENGADVVVKIRDSSVEQRWVLDSPAAAPRSRPDAATGGVQTAKAVPDVPPAEAGCGAPACAPSPRGGKERNAEPTSGTARPEHGKPRDAEAEPYRRAAVVPQRRGEGLRSAAARVEDLVAGRIHSPVDAARGVTPVSLPIG